MCVRRVRVRVRMGVFVCMCANLWPWEQVADAYLRVWVWKTVCVCVRMHLCVCRCHPNLSNFSKQFLLSTPSQRAADVYPSTRPCYACNNAPSEQLDPRLRPDAILSHANLNFLLPENENEEACRCARAHTPAWDCQSCV